MTAPPPMRVVVLGLSLSSSWGNGHATTYRALLDAFAPVFPAVRFMPSGGVDDGNLGDYLAHRAVFAASGSWIASAARVADGPGAVAQAARAALDVARTAEGGTS